MFSWIVCPNRREYRRRCETAGKSGKANREMCHFELPDRRKHGLQGRVSPVGGPTANRKMIAEFCISSF